MGNYKGKNVDEAIENGLSELNLKKSEVKINIIDHGNAGVFGFFEKEAEVEITPLSPLELKVKKLIPYLIGVAVIFIILLLVLFGGNSDKSTSVPTSTSTETSSIVEKSVEKTMRHHLHHKVLHLFPLVQLVPHQVLPNTHQQVQLNQL